MNKFVIIFVVALAACTGPAHKGFVFKGTLTGDIPDKVYLEKYQDKKWVKLDSSAIDNGHFELKGTLLFPEYLTIKIGKDGGTIGVFAENSTISVTAHTDSLDQAIIDGSAIHNQMVAFKDSKKNIEDKADTLYQQFKAATNAIEKAKIEALADSLDMVMANMSKAYVKEHPASVLSAFLINRELVYYLELPELESLTNSLSPALKESDDVKALDKRIDVLRTLQPGLPAPIFSQPDTAGNIVSIESFKGKYLFIDFWASWCGPCRRANPTVLEVYKKYSNKNFTILGVSMDKDREKWLEAIRKDGLLWTQVSTLEGWNNPVALLYGVNSIPHGILIGPDGKIVKRSIHVGELDELLAGLLE